MNGTLFTAMSATALSDLGRAKAEMSALYLKATTGVALGARAFRATAATAKTHNVVGVGIDEKYVDGVPTGVKAVKFLVKTKAAALGRAGG